MARISKTPVVFVVAWFLLLAVAACGSDDESLADPETTEVGSGDEESMSTTTTRETDDGDGAAAGANDVDADGNDQDAGGDEGELPEIISKGDFDFLVVGSASVSIGPNSYEFALLACNNNDGKLTGDGFSYDSRPSESEDSIQFWIQPDGSDASGGALEHAVLVVDGEQGLKWNAGGSPFLGPITFEHSMITDWSRDGATAAGSALFIEENEAYSQGENAEYPEPAPIEGSFEIQCDNA